jgi:PPK2 family polyphosphate:nucleotide phosphotransferase
MDIRKLRVKPGSRVKLIDRRAADTQGYSKEQALLELEKRQSRMAELQELLYASRKRALLIVLQAIDAGGKDGTIRHVMSGVNPQSCQVTSFKAPTAEELGHDFLWRIHKRVPIKGFFGIFNRSHYEDVLVVRVHDLVPKAVWSRRYDYINGFERVLDDGGVTILKFFLHISKDEQKKRLLEREQDPRSAWKLNPGDWKERELWGEYTEAYEDAISRTATKHAPWTIVPADAKWYRNLIIARELVHTLRPYKKVWQDKLDTVGRQRKADLDAYRTRKT